MPPVMLISAASQRPPSFPVSADALQPAYAGLGGQGIIGRPGDALNVGDAFLMKAGTIRISCVLQLLRRWVLYAVAMAMALDSAGNVYLAGSTVSNNLRTVKRWVSRRRTADYPRSSRAAMALSRKFTFGAVGPTPARVNVVSGFNGSGYRGRIC